MRSDLDIVTEGNSAAYIGGSYYEPAAEAQELGRVLLLGDVLQNERAVLPYNPKLPEQSYFLSGLFGFLTERLRPGEILFGLYIHPKGYTIAPFLYSEERLADFEMQVLQGGMRRFAYVAIDERVASTKLSL